MSYTVNRTLNTNLIGVDLDAVFSISDLQLNGYDQSNLYFMANAGQIIGNKLYLEQSLRKTEIEVSLMVQGRIDPIATETILYPPCAVDSNAVVSIEYISNGDDKPGFTIRWDGGSAAYSVLFGRKWQVKWRDSSAHLGNQGKIDFEVHDGWYYGIVLLAKDIFTGQLISGTYSWNGYFSLYLTTVDDGPLVSCTLKVNISAGNLVFTLEPTPDLIFPVELQNDELLDEH